MNTQPAPSLGRRAGRAFTRLVVTVLVLALAGAGLVLLSRLNARTYSVTVENGMLVVMKGRMLPMGAQPYRPSDPRLADAYAPLALRGHDVSTLVQERFGERDELDRALFRVLEALARPRVASDEPKALEDGLAYLRRAALLGGLTEEQRRSLAAMQADVSFFQARQKLDEARQQVTEALAQLQVAADSRNRHARAANQMLGAVAPAARNLEESLRQAVHSISAPAEGAGGTEAPPPPAPEARPESPPPGPGTAPPAAPK
jgi:hypothetical protein